jgi:hypothetical protein
LFLTVSMAATGLALDFGPGIDELTPIDRDGNNINVSALLFGDAFTIPGHHLEAFDGESGWWTRRIYFTADFFNLGVGNAAFRIRLEANQKDDFSSDYTSNLKDLYVQFRPGRHQIWLGRAPTLTFGSVEAHWGYRWFEKTPMDIQGTPSRLDGIRAAGPLTSDGPFYYRTAVGRGSDLGFATDDVMKGQVAFTWMPADRGFFADVYVDYLDESEDENEDTAMSYQLFGGWNGETNYAGLLYFHREWEHNAAERLRVASFYWVRNFNRWHLSLVGRWDHLFDPSVRGNGIDYIPFDPTATADALLAGVDIDLHKNFRIMPNVKYVTYGTNDAGIRPDDDVYLNLTVLVKVP